MGPTLVSTGVIAYAPSPPPAVGLATRVSMGALSSGTDARDGGVYKIVGTTKEKGTPDSPVMRRVTLWDQLSGLLVRSTWSDPLTGAYAFERIRMGTFFVVSFDHTGAYRAVVADGQIPELIT